MDEKTIADWIEQWNNSEKEKENVDPPQVSRFIDDVLTPDEEILSMSPLEEDCKECPRTNPHES